MNFSSSTTSDAISIVLISLQRICRNLSDLLNALDADVGLFERLLTQVSSSMPVSSSSSSIEDEDMEQNEDFYERLCDEQLEPRPARVTML
jgi:hypothetical protein